MDRREMVRERERENLVWEMRVMIQKCINSNARIHSTHVLHKDCKMHYLSGASKSTGDEFC